MVLGSLHCMVKLALVPRTWTEPRLEAEGQVVKLLTIVMGTVMGEAQEAALVPPIEIVIVTELPATRRVPECTATKKALPSELVAREMLAVERRGLSDIQGDENVTLNDMSDTGKQEQKSIIMGTVLPPTGRVQPGQRGAAKQRSPSSTTFSGGQIEQRPCGSPDFDTATVQTPGVEPTAPATRLQLLLQPRPASPGDSVRNCAGSAYERLAIKAEGKLPCIIQSTFLKQPMQASRVPGSCLESETDGQLREAMQELKLRSTRAGLGANVTGQKFERESALTVRRSAEVASRSTRSWLDIVVGWVTGEYRSLTVSRKEVPALAVSTSLSSRFETKKQLVAMLVAGAEARARVQVAVPPLEFQGEYSAGSCRTKVVLVERVLAGTEKPTVSVCVVLTKAVVAATEVIVMMEAGVAAGADSATEVTPWMPFARLPSRSQDTKMEVPATAGEAATLQISRTTVPAAERRIVLQTQMSPSSRKEQQDQTAALSADAAEGRMQHSSRPSRLSRGGIGPGNCRMNLAVRGRAVGTLRTKEQADIQPVQLSFFVRPETERVPGGAARVSAAREPVWQTAPVASFQLAVIEAAAPVSDPLHLREKRTVDGLLNSYLGVRVRLASEVQLTVAKRVLWLKLPSESCCCTKQRQPLPTRAWLAASPKGPRLNCNLEARQKLSRGLLAPKVRLKGLCAPVVLVVTESGPTVKTARQELGEVLSGVEQVASTTSVEAQELPIMRQTPATCWGRTTLTWRFPEPEKAAVEVRQRQKTTALKGMVAVPVYVKVMVAVGLVHAMEQVREEVSTVQLDVSTAIPPPTAGKVTFTWKEGQPAQSAPRLTCGKARLRARRCWPAEDGRIDPAVVRVQTPALEQVPGSPRKAASAPFELEKAQLSLWQRGSPEVKTAGVLGLDSKTVATAEEREMAESKGQKATWLFWLSRSGFAPGVDSLQKQEKDTQETTFEPTVKQRLAPEKRLQY